MSGLGTILAASHMAEAEAFPTSWQLVQDLGHLIPYVTLGGLAGGVVAPVQTYIGLNFFAQRHTDLPHGRIHCETSMLEDYCQQAVFDGNHMTLLLGVICPCVQFIMFPAVGAVSDAIGRRSLALAYHFVMLFTSLAGLSFHFFNTSLNWYFALVPITVNPITQLSWGSVVFYSIVTDRVKQPEARSAGLGILEAAMGASTLLGSVVGIRCGMGGCLCLTTAFNFLAFLYAALLLPESLPVEQRSRIVTWRCLLPGFELSLLLRNESVILLSAVVCLSGIANAGWAHNTPMYLQLVMNWTADLNFPNSIITAFSTILCLGVLLKPLASSVGDVYVVALCRTVTTVVGIGFLYATQPWHVLLTTFLSAGPTAMTVPAVAGLKSALVGPQEQGVMQGAVNTIYNVSSSIGVFIFGAMFEAKNRAAMTDPAQEPVLNKVSFFIMLSLSVPIISLALRVPGAMKRDGLLVTVAAAEGKLLHIKEEDESTSETSYGSLVA